MNIGSQVTVTRKAEILASKITYEDKEKSCGWVVVSPEINFNGTILGYKSGWFVNYWIVSTDDGKIVKVRA